jgi:hypothetical protein
VSNPYAPPKEGASRPDLRPDTSRAPRPGAPAGPPTPPGHPGRRPPAPPPDPEQVRRASRQLLHFWLLVLAAVVAIPLPLPWKAGALVLVLAALVVGGRALVTAWRARLPGLLLPMIVAGLAFAGLIALVLVFMLSMWPVVQEQEDCMRGALTVTAQEECERAALETFTERGLDLDRTLGSRPSTD